MLYYLQVDKVRGQFRDSESKLHKKETALAAMQTAVKHLNRNNHSLETEYVRHKAQLDNGQDEIQMLRKLNSTLQQQLSTEKNIVSVNF